MKTYGRVQEIEHTEYHKDMKIHGGLQEIEHTEDHKIFKTHGRLEAQFMLAWLPTRPGRLTRGRKEYTIPFEYELVWAPETLRDSLRGKKNSCML